MSMITNTSYLSFSPLYICMLEYVIAFTSVPWQKNATRSVCPNSRQHMDKNALKFTEVSHYKKNLSFLYLN